MEEFTAAQIVILILAGITILASTVILIVFIRGDYLNKKVDRMYEEQWRKNTMPNYKNPPLKKIS